MTAGDSSGKRAHRLSGGRFGQEHLPWQRLQRELQRLAATDPLIGLLNRREFTRRGAELARRAAPARPLSLLMIDVDHFKRVNDQHRHACGDEVLQHLAQTLRPPQQQEHALARLGGEEFAVLLDGVDFTRAHSRAEQLRASCSALETPWLGRWIRVSVSVGMATQIRPSDGLDGLLSRADRALYQAKSGGRDQVVGCE